MGLYWVAMKRALFHCLFFYIIISGQSLYAANASVDLSAQTVVPDRLLIKYKPGVSAATKSNISKQLGAIKSSKLLPTSANQLTISSVAAQALATLNAWEIIEFSPGSDLAQLISVFAQDPAIDVVQPDYILHTYQVPNDTDYNLLWGMKNIDAPLAWDVTTGSKNVVVAVIDTGVSYTHSDLAANMWRNPNEIPNNNLDDDGNGIVDDYYGANVIVNNGDPMDDNGHGTHVAGTIGAVGNNSIGVVGVNWNVSIMALKFSDNTGKGITSDAITAIKYAVANGANIINASWGSAANDTFLQNAISAANSAGVLFVAAAGNGNGNPDPNLCQGYDNDSSSTPIGYPASFTLTNIISVASIDETGLKSCFSNFGLISVDLAAPGRGILSTWNNGAYNTLPGTSMAAPHVTGAAALLWAAAPNLTHLEIKNLLLQNTKPNVNLSNITVTGGQLNVWNAIQQIDSVPPASINSLASNAAGSSSVSLTWTAVGDDGIVGQVSGYDLRFSSLPLNTTNFLSANPVVGVTATKAPGFLESFTVNNLSPNTAFNFAIVALDDVGNRGAFSNVVSATTNVANLAPIANPGGPYSGNPNTAVSFSGAASADPEGMPLTYSWNFGDGTTGTGVAPSHIYTAAGNFTVTLVVNDTLINSLPVTTTVAVVDRPPVAVPGGPYSGAINQAISFDGSGSFDPDGDVITQYLWNFNDGSPDQRVQGMSVTHAFATAGLKTVTFTVTTLNSFNSVQVQVNVLSSLPLVAKPGGPYSGGVTQPIQFDGSGSVAASPGNTITSYAWNFGDQTTGTGVKPVHIYAQPGNYNVSLSVSNGTNQSPAASTQAAIALPIARPGGPYSGTAGSALTFNGNASTGTSGNALSYQWNFGDGITGTGRNPSHTYTTAGTYSVQLTVNDGFSPSSPITTTATIAAKANLPPTISTITATPQTILDNATSALNVTATDPENATLSYSWSIPNNAGSLNNRSSATPIFTPPNIVGSQVITLTVVVSDGVNTVSGSIQITVNNAPPTNNLPPTISLVSATPASILDTATSLLSVTAADPENAALSYLWSLPNNSGSLSNVLSRTPLYTPMNISGSQSVTISVVVSDGVKSVSGSVQVTITDANPPVNNLPPVISQVTATPTNLLDTATSALNVIASDPESTPLSYLWSLPNNSGTLSNPLSRTPVYSPMNVVRSQTVTISVVVSDGVNSVSSSVQVTVTDANPPVNNLPPVISQISATPATILDTETTSLRVTATDPENVALIYNWRIGQNGAGSFDDSTSATPVFTPINIAGGQSIMLVVDVSDGVNTVTDSVHVTVNDANPPGNNLPPSITQIMATPSSITDTGTSTLSVSATDPENAQLIYRWSVMPDIDPNLVFSDPNSASPIFTPGNINGNKTITVSVEVSDGINAVSRSTDITISDANPAPALRLLSENFQLADLAAWSIVDVSPIANSRTVIQAPSQWSTSAGSLIQSSNIYSTNTDFKRHDKLGTYSLYNNGMNWTDYRLKLNMQSQDNDALGVMFRVQNENNYYRFSWDKSRQSRQLLKNIGGTFSVLAEDNIPYVMNQVYRLEIIVKGNFIQVLIDDQVIFSVVDIDLGTSINQGSIGLYSWSNAGSIFDNIVVDNITGINLAPIINNITTTKTNLLDTETSKLTVNAFDPDSMTALSYIWSDTSGTGIFSNRNTAQTTYTPARSATTQRVTLNVEVSDGTTTSNHSILLTISDANTSGTLLNESFSNGNNTTGWTIQDAPGAFASPSAWKVIAGQLKQTSNIYSLPAERQNLSKLGSYISYVGGATWQDYRVTLLMSSMDNDSLGVMFRLQDDQNYYRISWDQERSYRRLVKQQGGSFVLLHEDTVTYDIDTVYTFEIVVQNTVLNATSITINTRYIDNNGVRQQLPPISVTDNNPIPQGTIGLYNWLNSASRFDDIVVDDLTGQ